MKHKSKENCWTVVDSLVYDVTEYIPHHPGGKKIMLGAAKDASVMFRKFPSSQTSQSFPE